MSDQQTPTQPQGGQGGAHSLQTVLQYILSSEGLEQNLDVGLNLTPEGSLALQLLANNANVTKLAKTLPELLQVGVRPF